MSSNLDSALFYLRLGWYCIPINMQTKAGHVPYANFNENPEDARKVITDDMIRTWWKKWPDAGIGVLLVPSELMAIDYDTDEDAYKQNIEAIRERFPFDYTTANDVTPSRGFHYLYKCDDSVPHRRIYHGIDLLTKNFVCLPPSTNGSGNYQWSVSTMDYIKQHKSIPINNISSIILSSIKELSNISSTIYIYKGSVTDSHEASRSVTSLELPKENSLKRHKESPERHETPETSRNVTDLPILKEGTRDFQFFELARYLLKGGMPVDKIRFYLTVFLNSCTDPGKKPYTEKEIIEKIKSAEKYAAEKSVSYSQEVYNYIINTTGGFSNYQIQQNLNVFSKDGKHAIRQALLRFKDKGIIEKVGNIDGQWRVIDQTVIEQRWWEEEGVSIPLDFPLEIGKLIKLYPGSTILLEGQKSQGKSAFALEFCRMNKKHFKEKALYQNVEMTNSELFERFESYADIMTLDAWKNSVTFIRQTENWWDKVLPDGLNVIDYLIEYSNPYLIAEYVWKIHKKLSKGIAFVIIQRDPTKPYGTGGARTRDIPRAIISLINHKVRIEDVKSFYKTEYGNPSGLSRRYKLVKWSNFVPDGSWDHEEITFEEDKKWKTKIY